MSHSDSMIFSRSSPWYYSDAVTLSPVSAVTGLTFSGALNLATTGRILLNPSTRIEVNSTVGLGANVLGGGSATTADDVGLARSASGTWKITDGGAGNGLLHHGMGTGSGNATMVGVANVNTTAVGNVGVGTDDLITYAHPANSLSANGKGVRITAWGTGANNANAKTVTLNYGGTILVTQALTASQVDTWHIDAMVIRTGAATQEAVATLRQGGTVTLIAVTQSNPAETLTGAITIKCTGAATSDNDIVQEGLVVEMIN